MPNTISSRSIYRKLVKEGKALPRTPMNEYATWPTDPKGNPMHPTKGFGKYSRSGGKRGNRTAKRRTANRGPSPMTFAANDFALAINDVVDQVLESPELSAEINLETVE